MKTLMLLLLYFKYGGIQKNILSVTKGHKSVCFVPTVNAIDNNRVILCFFNLRILRMGREHPQSGRKYLPATHQIKD
jgi:hypothetical protein